ncbi:DUF1289 domain-containing protein [Methyloprofundus sedimenti]|uniref:DUF1289 domain-containing protein n=1 Tax=Methyloprofundus sedimenti TaxID=1420851 RepID=UPI0009B6E196|nr:DUF1289 domain-containing protein [Methyloprofundus sedimenti]
MQLEDNTLYYIYDPMCSWCYAFEQSLSALQKQLPAELTFTAILGGLAADSKIPMPLDTQVMIQQAWRQIELTVPKVRFNFDFWTKNIPYRSTYPACRAILAATNQSAEFANPMRQVIQRAYYQDAKNPSLNEILIACASELPLNISQFSHDLLSLDIDIKLTEHRHFSRRLGVSSYPSLRLVLNAEIYTIPVNYTDITPSLEQINNLLNSYHTAVIESPCIRECSLNNEDMCVGCFRLMDEITQWAYCKEPEKQAILNRAQRRKILLTKKPV